MESVKYNIKGSGYVGVFATASDNLVFVGSGLTDNNKKIMSEVLGAKVVEMSVSGSDLVGLFARANSNGIVVSSLMMDDEVEVLKRSGLGINIGTIESDLNAIGSNVLCNDKIAIVNSDYDLRAKQQIGDTLGVEVIEAKIGGFRTVGANNILTNKGLVVSNRCTDQEKGKDRELVRIPVGEDDREHGFPLRGAFGDSELEGSDCRGGDDGLRAAADNGRVGFGIVR